MSEEIKLTPSDFEELKELIDFMREMGRDKVKVMTLTLNFRNVLYKLGYSDKDMISTQEIEKHVKESWEKYFPNSQFPETSQDEIKASGNTFPISQTVSQTDDQVGESMDLWLEAIGKVINTADRPVKRLAVYLLLRNKEMFDPDLRRELAQLGTIFSRKKEPYDSNTIAKAISFVRNSPHVWSSKDPTTGMFVYRLKEKTAKKIIDTLQIILKEKEVLQKQEELKQADREKVIEAAIDFYENVYKQKIIELTTFTHKDYLLVDWQELRSYNPELAEYVVENPEDAIDAFETALKIFRRDRLFLEPGDYAVHFTNVGEPVRVKNLKDRQLGKMVTVRAMVSGVTSKKKLFYRKMVFVCQDCGWETARIQDPIAKVEWPAKCEACGSRNIKVDPKKSEVRDIVFFALQDMVEDLGNKEQPSKVSAYMLRPHASLAPGDRVLVTGILRDTIHKDRRQNNDMVLEVLHVEFLDDIGVGELSEEDIAEIKKLKEKYGDELPDAVARSLAPGIFADPKLLPELWFFKKAIVYAIASPKELGPGDERLWIHVLAVGDKGTGKSRIIRDIKNVTVAVYGEGGNVSGAGLIGMPEREELTGEWVFRGGLMVRANGFVLALDEFEKAKADDYARMHGGMSYGTVDFSKASISTTLKTMESVIAAANPVGGYFNDYKGVFEQITLPSSLLDRFDVIFILRQPKDPKVIEAIYDHQEKFEKGLITREIPEDLLRKFFLYVRELRPEFTDEAYREIKRFGLMVNKALVNAGFKYSMRLRGILKRLSLANALLRLSERVELKDVLAAEEVFTAAIRSWGDKDVDWSILGQIEAQASKEELELLEKVEAVFKKLHEYYTIIPESEIIEALEDLGLDSEKARYALELAHERGLVVEREKGWILASRA
ncbi:minichromosome maintenance protein MCM [Thermococcus prieurii]